MLHQPSQYAAAIAGQNLSPWARYQRDLAQPGFTPDAAQEAAVRHLQSLCESLVAANARAPAGKLKRLTARLMPERRKTRRQPIRGLYLWGGVGRGKTYLMDTFYEALPFERKMRVHFHRFMQRVHQELTQLRGTPNPLEVVAKRFSREAKVICFDEFFVSDIGDAMILAGLLDHLFGLGVSLVCTSNIEPDGLYRDGLQRARFLPAIALVKQHTLVLNVDGGVDYRLRTLEQAELFHWPLGDEADQVMLACYQRLALEAGCHEAEIEVNGRPLKPICHADDVIWFDFASLCDAPRSPADFIELAREYHAVLISNVPKMGAEQDDQARRFINLVDEFYDRNVKVILSAAAPIQQLYHGGRLSFEFERTQSRLLEMQSHDYLQAPHRA